MKGRLAEAYTGTSPKITDIGLCYSARGETTDVWESTPNSGGFYRTTASYWANGLVNTLNGYLASGSTFVPIQTYTPDGEGRWKSVAASSGPNPITTTSYNPASQITGITYGSSDSDSFTYDNALRMNKFTFTLNGSSEVGTPTWNSNGTLQTLVITDPFNAGNAQTCTYAYDDLARISSVNCGAPWSQIFSYDPFGNITKTGSISWQPGYNQSTNHYTLAGTTYDADGNLTNDTFHAYAWDSNGRPVSLGGKTMTYDALGRMVEKLDGSTYTQFVYSPSGSLFARMSGQSATSVRVPLPGSWAVYGSSSFNHYEHLDWLGNSRLSSNQSRQMTSDIAYASFGEPYASSATSGVSFTGMRSDVIGVSGGVTNGLYDFLARELPPTQGRWLSPDPAGLSAVDPTSPQSWNRYAYVANQPTWKTDPTGLRTPYMIFFRRSAPETIGCLEDPSGFFGPCESADLDFFSCTAYVGACMPIAIEPPQQIFEGERSIGWPLGNGNPITDIWQDALGLPTVPCQAQFGPWCDPSMLPDPSVLDIYNKQKNQDCLNKINDTPDGKFYNKFSYLSPFIGPDAGWGEIGKDAASEAAQRGARHSSRLELRT